MLYHILPGHIRSVCLTSFTGVSLSLITFQMHVLSIITCIEANSFDSFSALTLLVGLQEGHPASKKPFTSLLVLCMSKFFVQSSGSLEDLWWPSLTWSNLWLKISLRETEVVSPLLTFVCMHVFVIIPKVLDLWSPNLVYMMKHFGVVVTLGVKQQGHRTGLPPPFPFGRICFVVLVMRKGGESSWSGPWHLGCRLEVSFSMCTATRTSSYSLVGPSVFYLA